MYPPLCAGGRYLVVPTGYRLTALPSVPFVCLGRNAGQAQLHPESVKIRDQAPTTRQHQPVWRRGLQPLKLTFAPATPTLDSSLRQLVYPSPVQPAKARMAPASEDQGTPQVNPLISTQGSSELQVILHPLVLLSISDYITRHTLRKQDGPLIGALLGQQNGREITIEHAFDVHTQPGAQASGGYSIHLDGFQKRYEQSNDDEPPPRIFPLDKSC